MAARMAHVICCNDSVESVVVDDELKAKKKMKELSEEYFEKNKCMYDDSQDRYKSICFWRIHTVPCE